MPEPRGWCVRPHRPGRVLRGGGSVFGRFGLLLLACVLVCAGCSGSEEPIHKTMESVLLQLSDFPPSWRSFPASDKQNDLLGDVASCTGVPLRGKSIATARSGEFRNGQQRITSTAVGFDGTRPPADRVTALGNPRADDCMAKAARNRVLEAVPGATITSAKFTVGSGGVNVAANLAGTATGVVTVEQNGKSTKVYLDTVFLLGRDFYCDVTFLGVGKPVSNFVRSTLTNDVAARAQRT